MSDVNMGLPIGAVERETGISKDLLRMWERRYGFPEPARDEQGDRLYSRQQVEKLRLVRRLMDMGFRPGKIINLPMAELLQQVQAHQPRLEAPAPCHELIRVLLGHNPAQVQAFYKPAYMSWDYRFLCESLLRRVINWWVKHGCVVSCRFTKSIFIRNRLTACCVKHCRGCRYR